MPLSRPRRRKKHKIHPAWEALLTKRIDAVVASGGAFGRPPKGNSQKSYSDGSFTEAIREGEVRLEDLLASSEVCASGKTKKRWRRAAEACAAAGATA
jgi:hypothetical protein